MPPVKSNQDSFRVEVAGLPGTWSRHTSPESTVEGRKDYDGGARTPDVITSSKVNTGDVVVSRNYRVDRDGPMVAQLRRSLGAFRTSVSVTPLDPEGVRSGPAEVFNGVVTSVKAPDSDANAANQSADVQVTIMVESVSGG
jgi:hypothetical protein